MSQIPFQFSAAPASAGKRLPSYIEGHRERLRDRFIEGGAAAMPDYELLELVLFRAARQGDVKPVARRLIDTFGDFASVMSAPVSRLTEVKGVGKAIATELKIVEASAHRLAQKRVLSRPVISSWQALLDYVRAAMAHETVETFRALYLDRKNILIADEEMARGTVDHVPVYPREIVKHALLINASALIIVHNHPSGDPTPSETDIVMTRQIAEAAQVFSITLHDHLIVGRQGERSLRSDGLL